MGLVSILTHIIISNRCIIITILSLYMHQGISSFGAFIRNAKLICHSGFLLEYDISSYLEGMLPDTCRSTCLLLDMQHILKSWYITALRNPLYLIQEATFHQQKKGNKITTITISVGGRARIYTGLIGPSYSLQL